MSTIAEKLITIADNSVAVVEVVNDSKTTISGTNIQINDVLDVEHELEIYANEGTEVTINGSKNLFNKRAAQYSGAYCSSSLVDGDLIVKTTSSGTYISANFLIPNGDLLIGKTITFSGEWEVSGANTGCVRIGWANKDNKHAFAGDVGLLTTSGKSTTKTIGAKPANAGELCVWLYGNLGGTGATGATVTYRNVQVEIGSSKTDYEDYRETQTAIANADGRVIGIKSVSPTMSLMSNEMVECSYFPMSAADIYGKYQQLKSAEIKLFKSINKE